MTKKNEDGVIPEKYQLWVLVFWTALTVCWMASEATILGAIRAIGCATLVTLAMIFAIRYQKWDSESYTRGMKDGLYQAHTKSK